MVKDVFGSEFAYNIYKQKYSMDGQESWEDTCTRVVNTVTGQLLPNELKIELLEAMIARKFIPGGRYLYSAGRKFHQVNNCMSGNTEIITNKGIRTLKELEGQQVVILNKDGEWEQGEVKEFGKQELFRLELTNNLPIVATANHRWWLRDGTRVTTDKVKQIPLTKHNHIYELDEDGIRHGIIYGDGTTVKHLNYSHILLIGENKQELVNYFKQEDIEISGNMGAVRIYQTIRKVKTGWKIGLQSKQYKQLPDIKNITPEYARGFIAGLIATDGSTKTSTVTISCEGLENAQQISKIATLGGCVVTQVRVDSKVSPFSGKARELCIIGIKPFSAPLIRKDQIIDKQKTRPAKLWVDVKSKTSIGIQKVYCVTNTKSESFTLANGLTTSNCFLFRARDSRESWAECMQKATAALMTGGGIGFDYSLLREEGAKIKRTGGESTGPIALMNMINESGRYIMQGGARRSAIWAGLQWDHKDIFKFLKIKDYPKDWTELKQNNLNFPLPMEGTNISVIYNTEFFIAVKDKRHPKHDLANRVWLDNCWQAFKTAEPGMSMNFCNDSESLRNACTEVVSSDDSDKCNLGTVWLPHCKDKKDFARICYIATIFLLCGGIYSDVPAEKIKDIGLKNNRIGLGLGGIHEWLMLRGARYSVTTELHKWLNLYERESDSAAYVWAKELGVAIPKGKRAVAPTGCQRGDTLITTEHGLLQLDELGDINGTQWQDHRFKVSQEYLGKAEMSTKFFVNGKAKTKKIKLSSGCELEATYNHQYRVLEKDKYIWKRSDMLKEGDKVIVALNTYQKEAEPSLIPVPQLHYNEKIRNFPTEMNPKLAEFIGLFIGDGSIHEKGIRIACNASKPEEYNHVKQLGEEVFGVIPTLENNKRGCVSVCFNSKSLLRYLFINNLYKKYSNKAVIPSIIRCSSRNSLEAFLIGHFKADGSSNNSVTYIDTASKKLSQQILFINRSLGYDCSIREHVSGLGSKIYRVIRVKTLRKDNLKGNYNSLISLGLPDCRVDIVKTIEDSECLTYDISVPNTVTYIANSVVSHNTIGIMAETTTGIEPLFCKAYKRRYLKKDQWHYEYVVDGAVKRLLDKGVSIDKIQDSYDISFKERVKFQADVQNYVDMAISSTCNLPAWGTELNNQKNVEEKAKILLKYAKRLRGFTCYPDGARVGQPLERVSLKEALDKEGVVFEETEQECVGGICSI